MTERCESVFEKCRCERAAGHPGNHASWVFVWEDGGPRKARCEARGSWLELDGQHYTNSCTNPSLPAGGWRANCESEHRFDAPFSHEHDVHLRQVRYANEYEAWIRNFQPTQYDLEIWRAAYKSAATELPREDESYGTWRPAHHALMAILKLHGRLRPAGTYGDTFDDVEEMRKRVV